MGCAGLDNDVAIDGLERRSGLSDRGVSDKKDPSTKFWIMDDAITSNPIPFSVDDSVDHLVKFDSTFESTNRFIDSYAEVGCVTDCFEFS